MNFVAFAKEMQRAASQENNGYINKGTTEKSATELLMEFYAGLEILAQVDANFAFNTRQNRRPWISGRLIQTSTGRKFYRLNSSGVIVWSPERSPFELFSPSEETPLSCNETNDKEVKHVVTWLMAELLTVFSEIYCIWEFPTQL
jgi:hypothetical protein